MLRVLAKNTPAKATGAHISIVGHVTRDELLRYLDTTEAGNGFGNRFLWFCVRRSKTLPEGWHLPESKLSQLVKRLRKAVEESAKVRGITRNEKARAIWAKVYPALSEGNPGLLGAMTSRAEAHVIFGDALGDPLADEIFRLLRTIPDGVTQTEISNYFRRHKPAVQIVRALKLLTDQGLVIWEAQETAGWSATVWKATGSAKQANQATEVSLFIRFIRSNAW